MCGPTTCPHCQKVTWRGCGNHIESALAGIPAHERCAGYKTKQCPRQGRPLQPVAKPQETSTQRKKNNAFFFFSKRPAPGTDVIETVGSRQDVPPSTAVVAPPRRPSPGGAHLKKSPTQQAAPRRAAPAGTPLPPLGTSLDGGATVLAAQQPSPPGIVCAPCSSPASVLAGPAAAPGTATIVPCDFKNVDPGKRLAPRPVLSSAKGALPPAHRFLREPGVVLVDVRTPAEAAAQPLHLLAATASSSTTASSSSAPPPRVLNASALDEAFLEAHGIDRHSTPLVVFCASGRRAAVAVKSLEALGCAKVANGLGVADVAAALKAQAKAPAKAEGEATAACACARV